MARFLIGLFAIALLVAIARAEEEATTEATTPEPDAEKAAEEVKKEKSAGPAELTYKFLKKLFSFTDLRGSCIARSMDNCGYNIGKAKDTYKCYKNYYSTNKLTCLKKYKNKKSE